MAPASSWAAFDGSLRAQLCAHQRRVANAAGVVDLASMFVECLPGRVPGRGMRRCPSMRVAIERRLRCEPKDRNLRGRGTSGAGRVRRARDSRRQHPSPQILVSVDDEVIEAVPRYSDGGWSADARAVRSP
jgi:hypothetical protein